ncbi:GTP 3',8-cyclase MoaA [Acidithiobacillus caldus]|jgi:cyclic pyranopterin phosphate synthase|uniref:Molybdenum cofactor biosynthesis protein A n=8 Tax=Acidithiobacillus caldus TaxID=33059 RepID=F9ZNJ9_ACICS|nr:GTP 3',8-cyclase MoaA [Acidithiobacillus caldus]AEK58262.1 Molybdenum cofactor biosynthesis protein A [Acidithiobacillus caldus SM-1]AIA55239.1 Molybdenum cofactor biosynthesis protein MoaA [Acidithiobacillus caldus ATCC 51756]AUW32872.1 GTP 3',8-cyclase MoaA [Acidithiobacillus caldus]MBU2789542.1 GTP 3',8-cyclase MoaA [Acidithiobacillus caldus]MBU2802980.1 GTP 3',8-cyclase MoaA [Acidithiobacillus caldus]
MSSLLRDGVGRSITYLRLSLTEHCNFACRYCSPEEGSPYFAGADHLTLTEYGRLLAIFGGLGVQHVRLTGGEPLIYPRLAGLLEMLPTLAIPQWSVSTNGVLLPRWATPLREAGVRKVNISLDTLDPQRFAWLTRGGSLAKALHGIEAALDAGFDSVAINVVLLDAHSVTESTRMVETFVPQGAQVRFIETMPLGPAGVAAIHADSPSVDAVREALENRWGALEPAPSPDHHGPATFYRLRQWPGMVGFIAPWSAVFCDTCNRVRLTASGRLHYCLGQERGLDLRALLRSGAQDATIAHAIAVGIAADKPQRHHFHEDLRPSRAVYMMQLGG